MLRQIKSEYQVFRTVPMQAQRSNPVEIVASEVLISIRI